MIPPDNPGFVPKLVLLWVVFSALVFDVEGNNYRWQTAEIGGGGFVTGTIFHPNEPNLVYARTDVGGIYRLDSATNRWVALNDDIGGLNDEFQHLGVLTIGLDPGDPNRVYTATGQYAGMESWKLPSRIYRSNDRGTTWTDFVTPGFKMAGNHEGRGTGERFAVDPLNGANILLGTSEDGVWRSTDRAVTWTRLTSFPSVITTINFVIYAPENASGPGPARRVYVAGCTPGSPSLWYSDNNGDTWNAVPDQPNRVAGQEVFALMGSFDAAGIFYVTYGDQPGPSSPLSHSVVAKMSASGFIWTTITPPAGKGGFAGIAADPRVAGHVVCTTLHRWSPGDEVYRSTDGGASWTPVLRSTGTKRLTGNSPWAEGLTPHWMTDIDIDPFNSDRAIFNTGFGLFQTTNLSAENDARVWTFFNDGLEELVPLGLLSPNEGPPLISVTGDFTGFRHDNLTQSPGRGAHHPMNGTNNYVTGAGLAPAVMIRQNNSETLLSRDGALTWTQLPPPPSAINGQGKVAISADGNRILWSPIGSGSYYSTTNGTSWSASANLTVPSPAGTPGSTNASGAESIAHASTDIRRNTTHLSVTPVADRVNSLRFYLWNGDSRMLLTSTDGAQSFTRINSALPEGTGDLRSAPGKEGHLWARAGSNGLYQSTNFGADFGKLSSVQECYKFDFGKAASGATYPAIFIWGKVNNVVGFFRSDNGGTSWTRINTNAQQFGYINDMAGDPRVFGRVYLGTSGRGVVYGEITPATNHPPLFCNDCLFFPPLQSSPH